MNRHPSTEATVDEPVKSTVSIDSYHMIQRLNSHDEVDARGEEQNTTSLDGEENRVETFEKWPKCDVVTPLQLARAGFHYIGPDDRVQCYRCELILHSWKPGDNPEADHRRDKPRCPHLSTLATATPLPSLSNPKHSEMKAEQTRLSSFTYWPVQLRQRPEELSRAGFYYAGSGDAVSCFYCGQVLHNWTPADNVWEEHARWSSECPFLLHLRGRRFVQQVQRKFSQSATPAKQPEANKGAMSSSDISELVDQRMKEDIVKTVLSLNYSADLVRRTLEKHLNSGGAEFDTPEELIGAVKMMEIEMKQAAPSVSSNQSAPPRTVAPAQTNVAGNDDEGYDIGPDEELASWQWHSEHPPTPMDVAPSQPKQFLPNETRHQDPSPNESPAEATASAGTPQGAENSICSICMDRPRNTAFMPCGHFVVCDVCATQCDVCPICRQRPTSKPRIYES